jgi:hypothetical protein
LKGCVGERELIELGMPTSHPNENVELLDHKRSQWKVKG